MVVPVLGWDESLPAYSPLATKRASASRLEQAAALHGSEDAWVTLDLTLKPPEGTFSGTTPTSLLLVVQGALCSAYILGTATDALRAVST